MEIILNGGKIVISKDVVILIARAAVEEVDGVVSISGGLPGGIMEFFDKKTTNKKGVKIQHDDDQVTINLSVVVKYGVVIPEVVRIVQEKVKASIEAMTEIEINTVNVFVQNIEL